MRLYEFKSTIDDEITDAQYHQVLRDLTHDSVMDGAMRTAKADLISKWKSGDRSLKNYRDVLQDIKTEIT